MSIVGFVILPLLSVYLIAVGICFTFFYYGFSGKFSVAGPIMAIVGAVLGYYTFINMPFTITITL